MQTGEFPALSSLLDLLVPSIKKFPIATIWLPQGTVCLGRRQNNFLILSLYLSIFRIRSWYSGNLQRWLRRFYPLWQLGWGVIIMNPETFTYLMYFNPLQYVFFFWWSHCLSLRRWGPLQIGYCVILMWSQWSLTASLLSGIKSSSF